MSFTSMKKDELVDLATRRFLFNDVLPPLGSNEYKELLKTVKSNNTKNDLIEILDDMDEIFFEVVSEDNREHPQSLIRKPYHATESSAGIDIYVPTNVSLPIGKNVMVASDISIHFPDDLVGLGNIRSSIGVKQGIRLSNGQIILDSDYFYAENGGNIFLSLHNDSNKLQRINPATKDDKKQGRVVQFIFTNYYIPENYQSNKERLGGIGSTNRGDE